MYEFFPKTLSSVFQFFIENNFEQSFGTSFIKSGVSTPYPHRLKYTPLYFVDSPNLWAFHKNFHTFFSSSSQQTSLLHPSTLLGKSILSPECICLNTHTRSPWVNMRSCHHSTSKDTHNYFLSKSQKPLIYWAFLDRRQTGSTWLVGKAAAI